MAWTPQYVCCERVEHQFYAVSDCTWRPETRRNGQKWPDTVRTDRGVRGRTVPKITTLGRKGPKWSSHHRNGPTIAPTEAENHPDGRKTTCTAGKRVKRPENRQNNQTTAPNYTAKFFRFRKSTYHLDSVGGGWV